VWASCDLSEELPKSGDVPMSPLPSIGGLCAIGGHSFNLKINLGYNCGGHVMGTRMSARA
jgi:hypothetical protein